MKKIRQNARANPRRYGIMLIALLLVIGLLLYRLGSLVGGLGPTEQLAARTPVGWHGIYHNPLNLPIEIVRSGVFYLFPAHGLTLTRLPNTLFGLLAIISFVWLVKLWHGRRTAIFAGFLFATSAWVLHVSRLASFDVLYLWAMTTLLMIYAKMHRDGAKAYVFYGSILLWGMMLYIPGLVWLLLLNVYASRRGIMTGWRHFNRWWQRLIYILAGLVWLPLLIYRLRQVSELKVWLGLPLHLDGPLLLLKHFVGVFVHLFIRGPQYPELWLGRAPLLDIFTLAVCAIGIYFYARNMQAARSRLLAVSFLISAMLVALGGPVSLSLLVPVLYLFAATGIAYLMREWLRTFPNNPLARGLGITLIIVAVALSCVYNLRAYFVAWPHNETTQATFRYRP